MKCIYYLANIAYINCNGKNSSVSHIKKDVEEITLSDVMDVLNGKKPQIKCFKSYNGGNICEKENMDLMCFIKQIR